MMDIDYTGLFIDINIDKFLNKNDYTTNMGIYDKIFNYYSHYKLTKFNDKEIIDLKFLLIISLKYKNNYCKTKEIIIEKTKELIQARFHLGILLLKLLKTKEEKEQWLDETIEFYRNTNTELSLRSLCNFLEDIDEIKNINKKKYKEIYADSCVNQADGQNGIIANSWLELALPVYKSLSLKEKYENTLKKYNDNMIIVNSEMKKHEVSLTDKKILDELLKNERILNNFFSEKNISLSDRINYLCSIIIFENFGKFRYRYLPFYIENNEENHKSSLIDLCSVTTFSGNKTVKTQNWNFRYNLIGREIFKQMTIEPAIEGLLNGVEKNEEIIDELLNSKVIFEEDKKHILSAINFYLNGDYNTFIYIIIPNFEKLLRNILVLNKIPDFTNKDTNPSIQVTLTLTETIKIIKEKKLLQIDLINKISQKLNEEDYENYRNVLCHRENDNIFSKTVANDLFLLLIQILKKYDKDELEIFTIRNK